MSEIISLCFSLLKWMCFGSIFLVALFMILMHLPNSPLKTIALRAAAGFFAVVAAPLYEISPIDLMPVAIFGPFGVLDNLAVFIAAIAAARYALIGPAQKNEDDHPVKILEPKESNHDES